MRANILKSIQLNQISEMIYMNENGEISKRRVKVISTKENTFRAYCFLRNTKRTFKIESVLAFVPVSARERVVG